MFGADTDVYDWNEIKNLISVPSFPPSVLTRTCCKHFVFTPYFLEILIEIQWYGLRIFYPDTRTSERVLKTETAGVECELFLSSYASNALNIVPYVHGN